MLNDEDKAEVARIATIIVRDVLLLAAEAASRGLVDQPVDKSVTDVAAERAAMAKFLES